MSGSKGSVRDRRVVLVLASVVAVVLGIDVLSGLVPQLDRILADAPILVVGLIVVTAVVLLVSTGRRPRT